MALKNLFDMAKADRYTEDGCEELNKAREADVEDRRYNIGEISEVTGLQKTAQGWKPPKETKFGKVKQNKEGQWGVQTKLGKGSAFLKHKSEKEAKRALSNYTRGYNTTERSKQDPHSDYARQQKQWNKEVDRMRKNRNAERRAEHASHFQENKPVLSQTDGKGNKVEIKITESKGGGFYIDKYVNGKHIGINNANTRESAEAKANSMMEQHMADPDYRAESKPAAKEPAKNKPAESTPEQKQMADFFKSNKEKINTQGKNSVPVEAYNKVREIQMKINKYNDWKAGKLTAKMGADGQIIEGEKLGELLKKDIEAEGLNPVDVLEETKTNAEKEKAPKPTMQQYMKAKQDIKQFEDTFKKQNEQYEARQRMGEGANALSPLWGRKPNDYKNDPQYKKAAELVKAFEAEDSAPRVLTGDTKIRVRKA